LLLLLLLVLVMSALERRLLAVPMTGLRAMLTLWVRAVLTLWVLAMPAPGWPAGRRRSRASPEVSFPGLVRPA